MLVIKPEMIESKEHAGTASSGDPIVYVLSKGGLHAFFTKDNGQIVTLGTAPHRGIAQWMAEKRDPGLKWNEAFLKKKELTQDDIRKNDEDRFNKIKELIFSPVIDPIVKSDIPDDVIIFYDSAAKITGFVERKLFLEGVERGELSKFTVVRASDLSTPASIAEFHPAFAEYFEGKKHERL